MSRKNIFEIVADIFDLPHELVRMRQLFEKKDIVREPFGGYYTILEYMRKEGFSSWKNRGRCVDVDDFLVLLDYQTLWVRAATDMSSLMTLIEIIYNFWHVVANQTSTHCHDDKHGRDFVLLKKIMDECLAHYNYKAEYFWKSDQLIVIEDKPEATAVAEIVEKVISYKVLRYNHYALKGDLQAKKDILLALGADLEPKRKQLQTINKDLEDGIFYILNNMNLRHNNTAEGDKNYRQAVADMDNTTLENWYDELYQMILLAYLQLDQVERNTKVTALKQIVTPKQ